MSITFAPEEIIQASKLRTISQRKLQKDLHEHEKLGVYFQNEGLSVVMLHYQRYKELVERLEELEELVEEFELEKLYAGRVSLPREKWVKKPENMSFLEFYQASKERTDHSE